MGAVTGYAAGGVIPGPEGEHGDEVPALLSSGCGYVIPTRRLSQQQLEAFAECLGAAALKPPRFLVDDVDAKPGELSPGTEDREAGA